MDVNLHAVERTEALKQRGVVAVDRAGLGDAQLAEVASGERLHELVGADDGDVIGA